MEDHFLHDPYFVEADFPAFALRYSHRTELRVGLKCPDYLGAPEVPARVHRLLRDPDIIVCLRNPVDRFLSAYFWYIRWSALPLLPPDEGIPRLLAGEFDALPMASQVLDFGRYAHHLRNWFAHCPRERVLVLLQDDLRLNGSSAFDQLTSFLGLEPAPAGGDESIPSTSNAGVYPLARLRFLRTRNKLVRSGDPTGTHVLLLPPRGRAKRLLSAAVAGVDRYVLAPVLGNEPPPTSPEVRSQLVEYYSKDVQDLQELIQRDLSAWLR